MPLSPVSQVSLSTRAFRLTPGVTDYSLACRWFYSFGEGVVPNTITPNTLPLPPPTLPPLAAPSSQPSTTLPSTGEWLLKLCVHAPNCKRLASSFCTNRACKSCCLKVYKGCSGIRGHRAINPQPQRAPSIIPPPSQPMSTSSPPLVDWL